MSEALRIKGSLKVLAKRHDRAVAGRAANGAISTEFRGNGRAALGMTNTDRTLGASTRQGWRLAVTKAERDAHNSRPTQNTAGYVAIDAPMTYITTTETDSLGTESVHPKGNLESVPFEHRNDHLAKGQRLARSDKARGVDNTVYSVKVRS